MGSAIFVLPISREVGQILLMNRYEQAMFLTGSCKSGKIQKQAKILNGYNFNQTCIIAEQPPKQLTIVTRKDW